MPYIFGGGGALHLHSPRGVLAYEMVVDGRSTNDLRTSNDTVDGLVSHHSRFALVTSIGQCHSGASRKTDPTHHANSRCSECA